jgi:hypothetical protein
VLSEAGARAEQQLAAARRASEAAAAEAEALKGRGAQQAAAAAGALVGQLREAEAALKASRETSARLLEGGRALEQQVVAWRGRRGGGGACGGKAVGVSWW